MPKGFYHAVTIELKALGYEYLSNAKGSHEKWILRETGTIMVVPRNLMSRHTANSILKDSGATKKL